MSARAPILRIGARDHHHVALDQNAVAALPSLRGRRSWSSWLCGLELSRVSASRSAESRRGNVPSSSRPRVQHAAVFPELARVKFSITRSGSWRAPRGARGGRLTSCCSQNVRTTSRRVPRAESQVVGRIEACQTAAGASSCPLRRAAQHSQNSRTHRARRGRASRSGRLLHRVPRVRHRHPRPQRRITSSRAGRRPRRRKPALPGPAVRAAPRTPQTCRRALHHVRDGEAPARPAPPLPRPARGSRSRTPEDAAASCRGRRGC